jgi:hypothetical protein
MRNPLSGNMQVSNPLTLTLQATASERRVNHKGFKDSGVKTSDRMWL